MVLMSMDSPPFDLQAYQPPISLWGLIQQHAPAHEREEIKSMLGESLIDQSLELHSEIDMLLEIWRDYREETTSVKPLPKLAEPPGLRDRLIQEIQFFVGSVKEKARNEGVNAEKLLSRHNVDVLGYALDTPRADSVRPGSRQAAFSMDGRETPMICSPTCSDRTSEASILSEEVEAMNEKLNILKLDEVVTHLRGTMEEEVETLLKDIHFLQGCLDDEATFRAESVGTISREPTLTELKDERSNLERELLSNMRSQTSPENIKPAFNFKNLGPSGPTLSKVKTSTSGVGKLNPVKSGPMKAFTSHDNNSDGTGTTRLHGSHVGRDSPENRHIRPHSGSKTRSDDLSVKPRQTLTENVKAEAPSLAQSKRLVGVSNLSASRSRSGRPDLVTRTHGDVISSKSKGNGQPSLEAIVTVTKGLPGEPADVRVLPSPPSSAKPTTPRPSSAQRFRRMVQDCRDYSCFKGGISLQRWRFVNRISSLISASADETDDTKRIVVVEQELPADDHTASLPLWRKICFAVGGAPYQTTNTVINFFISIFLLEVAEVDPYYVSIILFGGKAWDAITDPTCGYLVHRTSTRFGKFRPWILFSAPLACGAYFCLWYVPEVSVEAKFAWYFVAYCMFQMLLSGLHVPYTSMTMAVTSSQRDRDSVTAYRMVSEAVGVLLAVVVQGQLVSKYRKSGDCGSGGKVEPEELKNEKWSYTLGALVVIAAYMLCSITVFFGTKEKPGFNTADGGGFFSGARQVITYRPYVLLCAAFLFLSLAIAIVQGNLALYCTHSVDLKDDFSTFILILLIASILAMPLWQMCIVRFGKKSTFATGMILFVPTLISLLYVPDGNLYVFYPIVLLAGLSVSVALLLPWSMLPDVIDKFYLEHGTRKESIFYSFYVFFNKLSVGVGLGLSQLVLGLGGYKTGECSQPASVGMALRLLVSPGPVVFTLLALIALWRYPIDERERRRIKDGVHKRLQEASEKAAVRRQNSGLIHSEQNISVSYQSITESSGV
ncbi:uncharacterized protein LOC128215088 [Mya arenaria]|uniref:uncharacterized protein LOC128215088 n=1 Tax=Mya arenaria TaxID=6604 RepID=UPI0022DFF79E|nr:uncharacterized protein LOC128215088 [Mya arenaria]